MYCASLLGVTIWTHSTTFFEVGSGLQRKDSRFVGRVMLSQERNLGIRRRFVNLACAWRDATRAAATQFCNIWPMPRWDEVKRFLIGCLTSFASMEPAVTSKVTLLN